MHGIEHEIDERLKYTLPVEGAAEIIALRDDVDLSNGMSADDLANDGETSSAALGRVLEEPCCSSSSSANMVAHSTDFADHGRVC